MDLEKRIRLYGFSLVILALTIFTLIYFKGLIQPFVLAMVVWYLIRTTRTGIGKISIKGYSLPKWILGPISILLTFGFIWGVIRVISLNVNIIVNAAPQYDKNFDLLVSGLIDLTGEEDLDQYLRDQLRQLDLQKFATGFLNSISTLVGHTAMIVVYTIFLLIEENFMPHKIQNMLEKGVQTQSFPVILKKVGSSINTYFSVKSFTSFLTGLLSYFILLGLDIDFAILWAFLIFLFNYVPLIGSIVATLLPSLFAIFQYGEFAPFFWVFIPVIIVQLFVGNYIEPKLMGHSLNLSPLIVVISLSFWGSIWGIIGMVLSVPIISILVIIMSHFPETKNLAILFSEKGEINT